eukprot:766000-Hanusia_phi.AAC.12
MQIQGTDQFRCCINSRRGEFRSGRGLGKRRQVNEEIQQKQVGSEGAAGRGAGEGQKKRQDNKPGGGKE